MDNRRIHGVQNFDPLRDAEDLQLRDQRVGMLTGKSNAPVVCSRDTGAS